jgi:general secretion pathway protein A
VLQRANAGHSSAGQYYPIASMEAARTLCHSAWQQRAPVVVTGPTGVGKTLLLHLILADLPTVPRCVIPYGCAQNATELHQAILFDLGRPYRHLDAQQLRLSVWEFLLSLPQPLLLVIDDAQHLGPEALTELGLLANLAIRGQPAVVSLLAGPPSLEQQLRSITTFARLAPRQCRLEPWSAEETHSFLIHHGHHMALPLDEEGVRLLVEHRPSCVRRLLRVCATAEHLAQQSAAERVDAEAVWEALVTEGLIRQQSAAHRDPSEGTPYNPIPNDAPGPDQVATQLWTKVSLANHTDNAACPEAA